MPDRWADDFETIRENLKRIQKEKEEADKMNNSEVTPTPTTPATDTGDWYCQDAFKMENIGTHYCLIHDIHYSANTDCPDCKINGSIIPYQISSNIPLGYIQREAWKL